jgi:ABC-type transporter Mla subunit MlaD
MANIWKWFAIAAVILLVVVGSGLGYFFARSSADLGDTRADLAKANEDLSSTQGELTSTQNDLQVTQNTLVSTQNQLTTTSDNLTATQHLLSTTQSQLTSTQSQLTSTQSQLSATQDDLDSISEQLTDIQKVYPLKHFPDLSTLRTWLATQPLSPFSFQNTSSLQEAAMNDGWIISAGITWSPSFQDFVGSNTAILDDGDVYMFFSDDHTLIYMTNIYY